MKNPIRASEDFGWDTKQIPGAIFYIGNGENYPAIHTSSYDFNDEILKTAINKAKDGIACYFTEGMQAAQNKFN